MSTNFRFIVLVSFYCSRLAFSQTYTIQTFAGGGVSQNTQATAIGLGSRGVAADGVGNIFVPNGEVVLKVNPAGIVSVVAGNGYYGFSGDGGPATSAQLRVAKKVALDGAGNLYILDVADDFSSNNPRVRMVSNGIITTVAGDGTNGTTGDNGPATSAALAQPKGLATDTAGNLYIAELSRVRKVSNGIITTVAGTISGGINGDNILATTAQLTALGVAVDSAGVVYIADNNRVRKVTNGIITTIAGNGTTPNFNGDNIPATSAQLSSNAVAVDGGGNVYISDASNQRVRKISNGIITTIAGTGTAGFGGDGGPAITAQLSSPADVAVDAGGIVYLGDAGNSRIRKIANGIITTVAGGGNQGYNGGFGGDNGPATGAVLSSPFGVAVDTAGNVFIADSNNHRIRKVANGVITTIAGNGAAGYSGDNGPAVNAQLNFPSQLAVDSAGNLYIADSLILGTYSTLVRKVSNGVITTVAGNGVTAFNGDNIPATSAQLSASGIAVDLSGNLFISDPVNHRIRKISNGVITTIFDGSSLNPPGPPLGSIAVDVAGNIYFCEYSSNGLIRKISNGIVTIVAGGGSQSTLVDGIPATDTIISFCSGLAVDSNGNIFIATNFVSLVRKVSNGIINTVAGGPNFQLGDNGPATSARLNFPEQLAIDASGKVYIALEVEQRIRVLIPSSTACSFTLNSISVQSTSSGGSFPINIQTAIGCSWSVSGLPSWITVSGPSSGSGSGTATLAIAANPGAARTATLSIAGVSVTVTQVALISNCSFTISPGGQAFTAAGGSGSFTVTTTSGCSWAAVSTAPWVTITGANTGSGNSTVTFQATGNTGAARSGLITIAGLAFTVEEAALSISGFTNAGSMAHLAVAGGWKTTFTLVNPSLFATQFRLSFFDDNGNPLILPLNFPQSAANSGPLLAATLDRTLSPGAVVVIESTGPGAQALVGWAQLLASGSVNGFETFRYTAGTLDNQALVSLENRNASAYLVAFDNTNGFVAGIALSNTSSQSGNIGIIIRDDTGANVFSSTIALAAMAHTSFVLPNSYGLTAGKRGTVEFDAPPGVQISTLGIQYNSGTAGFSTIPALAK